MTLPLNDQAIAILKGNDRGSYTVPTKGLYPYQWNWDSAFAALGFAEIDLNRAWVELETLFSGQWANGMVPHIIFHEVDDGYFPGPGVWGTEGVSGNDLPSSGISQPPLVATFARKIFEKDPAEGIKRVGPLYDKIVAWHKWFMECRGESGAICVTHPWESGRDNAADWDEAMANVDVSGVGEYQRRDTSHVNPEMRPTKRDYDVYLAILYYARAHKWDEKAILEGGPFRVADPTLSFILLRAHRDLVWLGDQLGKDTSVIKGWIASLERGIETLWNPAIESYDAKDLNTGKFSGNVTSAAFLCWYAGLTDDRVLSHLKRLLDAAPHGVTSLDPENPDYNPKRYWRGPVWVVVNTLIGMGLDEAGHKAFAERLHSDSARLIEQGGFAEYFNPEDGTPAGGGTFTWTAACWLAWVSKELGEG
ncbi:hypothetical protein SAMN04515647_1454 [Cohaesibacter sp. ES.047]|uniref:MGH1-like glycoside hydrolase domain-containing protein n=1 Tax=Cohaesibacter sp. ES.047 TaxID=1798205 RepID=UPI000BB6D9B6|nr:hypothetical protein [Cohaesibacter sp. ES.047]SNY91238.1 hypothetical protein SAMN04515647_1454 [Cohaesibacter sp. ES.047]